MPLPVGAPHWLRLVVGVALAMDCACAQNTYVNVRGAGASFPSAVYSQWIPFYKATRTSLVLDMGYDAVGSGGGKRRIKGIGDPVEYAGSDSVLKEDEYRDYPDLQMFPTMAGAVVIGYNVPGISTLELTLTREILVGIYNGSITWWNDSQIATLNPHLTLPPEYIRVLARADKSGTTEAFTTALSAFSPTWNASVGVFSAGTSGYNEPVKWSKEVVWYYGQTTRGMSGLLLSIQYTLGYLSAADAAELQITTAKIMNQEGIAVEANASTVQSAMDAFADAFTPRMTLSLANAPGRLSYPIAAYTYFIIHRTSMKDCLSATVLYRYIEWFLLSERAQLACIDRNMVPLSAVVSQKIFNRVLDRVLCQGQQVKLLVEDEKYAEVIAAQTWRMPVFITVPIATITFFGLMAYIVYQQIKVNKAIFNQEYLVRSAAITLLKKKMETFRSLASLNAASSPSFPSSDLARGSSVSMKGMTGGQQGTKQFGRWDGEAVSMQAVSIITDLKLLRRDTKRLILWMRDNVNHANVVQFYGITELNQRVHLISSFCQKGTLEDVIHTEKFNLDNNFKFSMALDVAQGMRFLHKLNIVHGYLSTSACLIDSRWNVKVADWQLTSLSTSQRQPRKDSIHKLIENTDSNGQTEKDENILANSLFWTAPELIEFPNDQPTKFSDVYSFGMTLIELFTRKHPYDNQLLVKEPKDIIKDIVMADLRPGLEEDIPRDLVPIITQCWRHRPANRPPFPNVIKAIKAANPTKKSVLDCMMEEMENYVTHLEEKVAERTVELDAAMKQAESLLHKILPPTVAAALARGEKVAPEAFESVTIYFSDIVSFTSLAAESSPLQIVDLLNDLYTCFDDIIDNHDVYKVETIGDAYMCISGLPTRNGSEHARHIANMALDIVVACGSFRIRHRPGEKLRVRIGIHSGSVVAGVVGVKMPRYCLFGDTVNTASRMESNSLSNKIHLSRDTTDFLRMLGGFRIRRRKDLEIKGKGTMETYWLIGRHGQDDKLPLETTLPEPGDGVIEEGLPSKPLNSTQMAAVDI